jgi:NADPH-ferrihemoprotein reductase
MFFSTKKRIIYDAKNPYFSKIKVSRPLFGESTDEFSFKGSETIPDSKRYKIKDSKTVIINRQCIHMEFDIKGSGLRYETGDHVGIYGCNSEDEVNGLASALGLSNEDLDKIIKIKPNGDNPLSGMAKNPFPNPCSIRTALTYYRDIRTPIKQHQLEVNFWFFL